MLINNGYEQCRPADHFSHLSLQLVKILSIHAIRFYAVAKRCANTKKKEGPESFFYLDFEAPRLFHRDGRYNHKNIMH